MGDRTVVLMCMCMFTNLNLEINLNFVGVLRGVLEVGLEM